MRLFIALTLPEHAVQRLVALQAALRVGRRVPRENLHMTIAFLGERDEADLDAVGEALADLKLSPVEITLSGVETPGPANAPVLAAGVLPSEPLKALESRLLSRLRREGLDLPRRRFHPHVTIARGLAAGDASRLGRTLAAMPPFATEPFRPNRLAVFRSRLGGPTPVYEELGSLEMP